MFPTQILLKKCLPVNKTDISLRNSNSARNRELENLTQIQMK